jgi:hypothetical protein
MRAALLAVLALLGCRTAAPPTATARFTALMERVATGWSTGDARLAASCFAEDAVYEEPPAKQLYKGRAALYAFFGGEEKLPMKMRWHHLAFDEATGVGFGEYTFALNRQYHGVVVVKIVDGLIARWREYQYPSAQPYEEFARESAF